jgi:glycine/D-amino acid oxidase-like deaminating enzyme
MSAPDVAVIGGGIVGVSAAAFLAQAGARVELFERAELAAGASGRNSGAVQHPYDPELLGLHNETVAMYANLDGLAFDPEPAGVLVLGRDAAALAALADDLGEAFPELEPDVVDGRAAEPLLAPGVAACRLRSGHPVRPEAATLAFADVARAAGAVLHTGAAARAADLLETAGAVLVAAGPWTPEVVDPTGSWRPITPVWGVNVEVALEEPPRAILEEGGVESAVAGDAPPLLFSLTTADGVGTLGSTFLEREPDPDAFVPGLLERGRAFVPALGEAVSVRACARPQCFDGRPLLGAVPGRGRLFVAAGHGPWGISTGPASARLVADAILDPATAIPPALDVARACAA